MHLKKDSDKFDTMQAILVGEIIEVMKENLQTADLKGPQLKDVTGDIAFSIAALLDNSRPIEFQGAEVCPLLTFIGSNDELIHCGGNSYMHEYVFGVLDEVFES